LERLQHKLHLSEGTAVAKPQEGVEAFAAQLLIEVLLRACRARSRLLSLLPP
jgi:hypothetical protein